MATTSMELSHMETITRDMERRVMGMDLLMKEIGKMVSGMGMESIEKKTTATKEIGKITTTMATVGNFGLQRREVRGVLNLKAISWMVRGMVLEHGISIITLIEKIISIKVKKVVLLKKELGGNGKDISLHKNP